MKTAAIDREVAAIPTDGRRSRRRPVADFRAGQSAPHAPGSAHNAVGFYLAPKIRSIIYGFSCSIRYGAGGGERGRLNQWWERRADA